MARLLRGGLTLATLVSVFAACVHGQTPGRTAVNICTTSRDEQAFCANATAILNGFSSGFEFGCTLEASEEACLAAVAAGRADMKAFSSGAQFAGYEYNNLTAIAVEDARGAGTYATYFTVAVVNKAFCDAKPNVTFRDLRGLRSCHTGFRRTAGWNAPVGYLAEPSVNVLAAPRAGLPSVEDDAEAVAAFFNKTCAPLANGTTQAGGGQLNAPTTAGTKWPPLCTACKGNCDQTDPYYDYPGSLRGLMEDACDVNFNKHDTVLAYVKDGPTPANWSTKAAADLRLLCPSGGCAPITDYQSCSTVRIPTAAVMVRSDYPSIALLRAALVNASANPTFSGLVFSAARNPRSYLFSNAATRLAPINQTTAAWLGNFAASQRGFDALVQQVSDPVKICTTSLEEQNFCRNATAILGQGNSSLTWACVPRASNQECLTAVASGAADIRGFDATLTFEGSEKYNLQALAVEDDGDGFGASYFAVAVVNAGFCRPGVTFADLRGSSSCHTGYRRTAGWSVPVGFLANDNINVLPAVNNAANVRDDAESIAAFFGKVCAPPTSAITGPVNNTLANGTVATASVSSNSTAWAPLCTACKGDCTVADPYYSYDGVLRGLFEGGCNVSFTEHTAVLDYVRGGRNPAPWSTKSAADVRLLCPAGGCAPITDFQTCNVARVPARTVLARANYPRAAAVRAALVAAAEQPAFQALVFRNTTNPRNFLFSSATRAVLPVTTDTATFLGNFALAQAGMSKLDLTLSQRVADRVIG